MNAMKVLEFSSDIFLNCLTPCFWYDIVRASSKEHTEEVEENAGYQAEGHQGWYGH